MRDEPTDGAADTAARVRGGGAKCPVGQARTEIAQMRADPTPMRLYAP